MEALSELCIDLTDTLKQIADLSAELASRDHIRVDNIQEVRIIALLPQCFDSGCFQLVRVPDASFLQELDMGQKRSLVCRELERIKTDTQCRAKTMLSMHHSHLFQDRN